MFALRYLVAIACLLKGVTASGDPLDALATKSSLSGTFTQSIVSPEGLLLEQAEGRFQLLRPDYFWWRIQVPDQQLLVAVDGQLTQIDWDLEVVTQGLVDVIADLVLETRAVSVLEDLEQAPDRHPFDLDLTGHG